MSWHKGVLCAIDAETTGVDIESDRIVTWSRWIIDPAKGSKVHAGWLINPGVDIPEGATAVHGISTEHARERGQQAASAVREIAGDLVEWSAEGAVTVAFNAAYDISLLHRECLRHGHTDLAARVAALRPVVDAHVLDKGLDRYRKGSRKLVDVAAHYGIELSEADAHGSAADSLAAARVAYVIAERYPHIGRMDPDALHDLQREWRADQAKSLERYLRRKDPKAVVSPHWPLQPAPTQIQEQLR
ncbi:exonuclease domain-containing protein [Nocardiopsis synnemataformans]|uniref:exonuclease domain-containing protein n=1 Tax=Nocardiopsis synnemataformans TaxID=61305 RepID=UPI003EBDFB8E